MSENINEDELNSLALSALGMGGDKGGSSADTTANQNKGDNANTQKANEPSRDKAGDKPTEPTIDNAFDDLTKKRGLEREEFAKKQEEDLARKRRDEALDKIIAERNNPPKPQETDPQEDDDKPLKASDITKIVQDTVKNTLSEYENSKNKVNDEDKLISEDLNKFTESNAKAKQFEPQIKKLMQSHPTISAEFAYNAILGRMADLQASGKKLSIGTTKDNLNNNLDVGKMSNAQLEEQLEKEFGEGGNGMLFAR